MKSYNKYGELIQPDDNVFKPVHFHWPDGVPRHVRIGLDRTVKTAGTPHSKGGEKISVDNQPD